MPLMWYIFILLFFRILALENIDDWAQARGKAVKGLNRKENFSTKVFVVFLEFFIFYCLRWKTKMLYDVIVIGDVKSAGNRVYNTKVISFFVLNMTCISSPQILGSLVFQGIFFAG